MNEDDPTAKPDSAKPADRPSLDGWATSYAAHFPVPDAPDTAQRLSVGNVHLGAAAFAVLFVSTAAAYLKWLAAVEVPPEVLVPTGTLVGAAVGRIYPSD